MNIIVVKLMKIIRFTTIFFLLKQLFFLSFVVAQSSEVNQNNKALNQRLKLVDAHYILLNGDSVKIASLDAKLFKQVKKKIETTRARNIKIANAAMAKTPAKARYFIKNTLLLDSTYLPAHAALIQLNLQEKDTTGAYQNGLVAYRQTKSEKWIPVLSVLSKGLDNSETSIPKNFSFIESEEKEKNLYAQGFNAFNNDDLEKAHQFFDASQELKKSEFSKTSIQLLREGDDKSIEAMQAFYKDSLLSDYAAYNLAVFYYQEKEMDAALEWCNKGISNNDTLWDAYFLRAQVNYAKGEFENALSDYSICIEKKHKIEEALVNLAICQYDLKMFKEAVGTTSISIGNEYYLTESYLLRGNAYEMLHDFQKACEDWQKAIEFGREDILPLIVEFCKVNNPSR